MASGRSIRYLGIGCITTAASADIHSWLLNTFFKRLRKASASRLHTIKIRFGYYSPPEDDLAAIVDNSQLRSLTWVTYGQAKCPSQQIMSAIARSRVAHIRCTEYIPQRCVPDPITPTGDSPPYSNLASAQLSHRHAIHVIGPGFSPWLTSLTVIVDVAQNLDLEMWRLLSLVGENCLQLSSLSVDVIDTSFDVGGMLTLPVQQLFNLRRLKTFRINDMAQPPHFLPPSNDALRALFRAWPQLGRFEWSSAVGLLDGRGDVDGVVHWPDLSALYVFATARNLEWLKFPVDPSTPVVIPESSVRFHDHARIKVLFQGCEKDDDVPTAAVIAHLYQVMPERTDPRCWLMHQPTNTPVPRRQPFFRSWETICNGLVAV